MVPTHADDFDNLQERFETWLDGQVSWVIDHSFIIKVAVVVAPLVCL